ncbi:MAG: heme exporter protein CcmD [Betaproteobacteria bacterium]|nr:heme exporter protein CcmD [Betaproteobacteria bacterium]
MSTSEFGNVSWVYFVAGAYVLVVVVLLGLAVNSLGRYRRARQALNDEGFSDDKS